MKNATKPLSDRVFADSPCQTCPYRKDTPKGVWAQDHYEALVKYDGDVSEQLEAGAFSRFGCHYDNGDLCRGWIDCHGADNLAALRFNPLPRDPGPPAVPVYGSGREVLEANLPHMTCPDRAAHEAMGKISRMHERAKKNAKDQKRLAKEKG